MTKTVITFWVATGVSFDLGGLFLYPDHQGSKGFHLSTHMPTLDPYFYMAIFSAHIWTWAPTGARLAPRSRNPVKMLAHVWALLDNSYLKIDNPEKFCLVPPPLKTQLFPAKNK